MDAGLTVLHDQAPRRRLHPCHERGRGAFLARVMLWSRLFALFEATKVTERRVVAVSKIDDRAMIKEPADKSSSSSTRRTLHSKHG